jgi:type II secretory pathway pseudopilin PulG
MTGSSKAVRLSAARRLAGYSMLELAVVVSVLLILGLIFLNRVLIYQEWAEKTAAEATALNLRTAVRYRAMENLLRRQAPGKLVGSNPIQLVELPLQNYAGEFRDVQKQQIEPGNWFYDLDKSEICYRIRRRDHFVPGPRGRPDLCYRVTALASRAGPDGTMIEAEGVSLSLVEKYSWFPAEKN